LHIVLLLGLQNGAELLVLKKMTYTTFIWVKFWFSTFKYSGPI